MNKKHNVVSANLRTDLIVFLLFMLSVGTWANAAPNKVQSTYYVSPSGSGKIGSLKAPCSLTSVRDLIRKENRNMTGDIIVYLRGGVYNLTAPFELVENEKFNDSGTNDFNIIYKAYEGETPVVSGGIEVKGWKLHDRAKNIYKAKVPKGILSRQFYVDDNRCVRARGSLRPSRWIKTATGWTITDTTMHNWGNLRDIEIVSRSSWKHLRCDIESIKDTFVTMKMPGWKNCSKTPKPGNPWNGGGTQEMRHVEWVENAYELLDQPGEWYLDSKAGYVYYIPTVFDDMTTLTGILPVTETLLYVHGSGFDKRIQHIQFSGITFKYATWMFPSGENGYADNQAGVMWVGTPPCSVKTAGAISFQYASNVCFEKNIVAHMGGAGIDFGHAPQKCDIVGNCIFDISGNGIFLGEVDDYNATQLIARCDENIIQNNYIYHAGVEFEDQVGICVGYARNLLLDHNEVYDVPYSGISVGWGWSKMGYSHHNAITNNLVHKYMNILDDGGGIYTLGNQGTAEEKTVWSGNYIHHSGHAQGLYADEGSGFMEIKNNVVQNIGVNWLNFWTPSIHDITVHDNFSDKTNINNKGTNCTVTNNDMEAKGNNLPEAAQAIIKNAGLEPAFVSIKEKIPAPFVYTINDSDPKIAYTGAWKSMGSRKAIGDYQFDVHTTNKNGDTASFTFFGKGIEYITEFNNDEGKVDIYIDNVLVKTIDCKSPERVVQQVAYAQSWNESGTHIIKVEKKSGTYMLVDAFRVYNKLPEKRVVKLRTK